MPRTLRGWRHAVAPPRAPSSALRSTPTLASNLEVRADAPKIQAPCEIRTSFSFPVTAPSWYIGHMHRAMRSIPSLLARAPPPLVIEVRDARVPFTSINPNFEKVLQNAPSAAERVRVGRDTIVPGWAARRLVVYTKRDHIDHKMEKPIRLALAEHTHDKDVMFVDTRKRADVKNVYQWVCERAKLLQKAAAKAASRTSKSLRHSRLSGAARHTSTPETGVRMLIVGMPNVGKSSLINALRFVGTGKASAASTHPHPGHTRKVTGTVRITPDPPSLPELDMEQTIDMKALVARQAQRGPAVYVYDTPGIMVPYLGSYQDGGPERALKLAITGCIKQALFDVEELADYLLFRLNQRYRHALQRGDTSLPPYTTIMNRPRPTDDIKTYLSDVAKRAPGARQQGGTFSTDVAAEYMLAQFRRGLLGSRELDLALDEDLASLHNPTSLNEQVTARLEHFLLGPSDNMHEVS